MNYSINVTVVFNNAPIIFRITQSGSNEYFAACANQRMDSFTIKKKSGNWRSEGVLENWKAILIGEQIDKLNSWGFKGTLCLS